MTTRRHDRGFTLIELGIVVAILLVLMAIAIPSFLASRKCANEAVAASTLRILHPIQSAFRQGDLDGNGQPDFWTLDVSGLNRIQDRSGRAIALISEDIARSDGAPANPGGEFPTVGPALTQGEAVARSGHFVRAMTSDNGGPARPYQVDGPDADRLARENTAKFGFTAYPKDWNATSSGRWVMIITEEGRIWAVNMESAGPGGNPPAGTQAATNAPGGQLAWPAPPSTPDLTVAPVPWIPCQ